MLTKILDNFSWRRAAMVIGSAAAFYFVCPNNILSISGEVNEKPASSSAQDDAEEADKKYGQSYRKQDKEDAEKSRIFDTEFRLGEMLFSEWVNDPKMKVMEKDGKIKDYADLENRIEKANIRMTALFKKFKSGFYKDMGVHAELFWTMNFFASPTSLKFLNELIVQKLLKRYEIGYEELLREHPDCPEVQFWYAVMKDVRSSKVDNDQPHVKFYIKSINSYIERLDKLDPNEEAYTKLTNDILMMVGYYVNFPPAAGVKGKTKSRYIRGLPFNKTDEMLKRVFEKISIKHQPLNLVELGFKYATIPYEDASILIKGDLKKLEGKKKKTKDDSRQIEELKDNIYMLQIENWYRERFLYSGVSFENLVSFRHKGRTYQKYLDEFPIKMWRSQCKINENTKMFDYGKLPKPVKGKTHFVKLKNKTIYLTEQEFEQQVQTSDAVEMQLRTALNDWAFMPKKRRYRKATIEELIKKYTPIIRSKPWPWMHGLNKESAEVAKGPMVYECRVGNRP